MMFRYILITKNIKYLPIFKHDLSVDEELEPSLLVVSSLRASMSDFAELD